MSGTLPPNGRTESRLFLVVLALATFHGIVLFADHRAPADGSALEPGGLFQAALPLAGRFLHPISIAGMLIEELLLLVGIWRLASKLFPSPWTRYFVAISATGSSLWVGGGATNLRLVAALPLILVLLHDALEASSRRALGAAGSLMLLQAMGKTPTQAVAIPAAVALYWAGAALLYEFPLRDRLKALSGGSRDVIGAGVLLGLVPTIGAFTGPAGTGAPPPLRALLDLVLGLSPSPQTAGFCGVLTLAFAGFALAQGGWRRSARILGFVVAGLGALGFVSLLPGSGQSPDLPLLRLFVIMLAGAGFQGILDGGPGQSRVLRFGALGLSIVAVGLTAWTELAIVEPAVMIPVSETMSLVPTQRTAVLAIQSVALASDLPGMCALMAGLAAGVLFLWSTGRRGEPLALGLALVLHPLDLLGWKFRMTWLNTVRHPPDFAWTPPAAMPAAWAAALGILSLAWTVWLLHDSVRLARHGRT